MTTADCKHAPEVAQLRRALAWALGRDTGQSSQVLLAHMLDLPYVTYDPGRAPRCCGDLGRCIRLLELFPEWRERIHRKVAYGMADKAAAAGEREREGRRRAGTHRQEGEGGQEDRTIDPATRAEIDKITGREARA